MGAPSTCLLVLGSLTMCSSHGQSLHPTTHTTSHMMDTTTTNAKSQQITVLEERLNLLTDLYTGVDKSRQLPSVLRLPAGSSLATNVLAAPPAELLREGFEQLRELSNKLKLDAAQEALRAAKESEASDSSDLASYSRRRNLKRA